jgi:hypothetical protein
MRVFISHTSKDKPAVEKLARALAEHGIEPWLDKWEMGTGDDFIAKINTGLEEADAGIIVFSAHSADSQWVEAETSYLTYARIQEGKILVPVRLGEDATIPPLLRPLLYRDIAEVEAIVDALYGRKPIGPTARPARFGRVDRAVVTLRRGGSDGVSASLAIGGLEYAEKSFTAIPPAVARGRDAFLQGYRHGVRRDMAEARRVELEGEIAALGRALRDFCLPGEAAAALADLVDGSPVGATVEIWFEADDPELLGLPFEALRLPGDRLLATLPGVAMLRRPLGLSMEPPEPLAGPLKILLAVAAPDEDLTTSIVLDHERETQNILDATEAAQRNENAAIRILEIGSPELIGRAFESDAYHVLHISCHGLPGQLELEDEDGRAVLTTAEELLDPIRDANRPLPLVFLSACHGGVEKEQTASFAEELLRAGVPSVLAMGSSVSDHYASRLARAFYGELAGREELLPSRALAAARAGLERERRRALERGGSLAETQPEYATATLFVSAEEEPRLADFAVDRVPLKTRTVWSRAAS